MKTTKYILTLVLTAWCAVGNLYAITSDYYSSIDGKSGKDLFDAVHAVAKTGYKSLSYDGLWTAYQTTDVYPTGHANAGKIWDMYGNCAFTYSTNQCGNYSGECDCYNREHSIPKSWFGGTTASNTPGSDLFHVVPTDGKVNGKRSNYAFGEVNAASYTYAGSKLGTAKSITISNSILNASGSSTKSCSSTPVFEPVDEYKGDFARGYLGTMIRWANGDYQTFTTDQGASIFNTAYDAAHYYGLTEYGVALLLKWHREDPVSQKEIDRNNGIQAKQGNRNPFIDYPCLAEYLWGDKAGQTVTLSSLVGTFTGSWTTGDGCPCGTDPAITLPNGDIDCGATSTNTPVTKTITVQGVNLSANLSLAVSGTNSSFFTLSANSIQKAVAETGSSVTITYTPTSTGSHTATLTISGGGLASSRTFTLSGTCCNPYTVTLSRNNITETVSACGTYTLPTAEEESDACDGWEFQGWITGSTSFTENQTTAPSYTLSVSSTTTLYAVYAKEDANGAPHRIRTATTTWTKVTDASTLKSGDVLVIASNTSNATAGDISGDYMAKVSSTFSSDNSTITSLGSGTVELTLGGSAGAWTLSSTSGALGATAAKKVAWGSGTQTWSISISSGNATITNGTSSYGKIQYNSGSPRFTTYTSNQAAVQLYRKSGGSSTTHYKKMPCTVRTISYAHTNGVTTGGTYWADVTSALPGTTITLDYDPAEGYALDNWTVTGGSVTVTNNQFTMPDADVTVSATFKTVPKRTIRFYNNGTIISTQSVYEGSTPNVPSVEGCEGYTFVGWWTSALVENNTTEQTWITDFTVTQAQDYYAVFSHTVTTGSGGTATWEPVTSAPSDWSGDYIITNSGKTYAMTSDFKTGTSGEFLGASVTVTNNKVVSPTDKMIWTVAKNGNNAQYSFKNKSTGTYAKITGTSSTNAALDASAQWFTIESSGTSGVWRVVSVSYNARCFAYYDSNTSFRTYAKTSNSTGYLFKKTGGGSSSTTYYTSTTNCAAACTKLDAPQVAATPGNGQITLTWADVTGADHYTVTIGKGAGYTTECGSAASIGNVTGTTTKTCVITGLTNGLAYTTNVVANAASETCDSDADTDTATPQDCNPWDDPTLSWNKYSLNTSDNKTATKTLTGTTHGTLSFESSNTEVLTVNQSTGAVTAVGAGEATVTAHWAANGGYCEKTMTSSTFEVAGPLTISFDANADGVTGTMTDQTVTYKVSTAIKDNAFRREGYTFIGWATSADGEKVYNDKQSVAFTNSQTLYAKWQLNSRNVTFTPSPSGAAVTVNGKSTSPQAVNYGETVTVHITPANHYTITTVSIKGATSGNDIAQTGSGETRTFTMPDENVNVSVKMAAESQYTATFYNSGVAYGEAQTGYADDDINAPATNPVSCDADEFAFVGWVAAEQTSETTTKPEVLTFPQTMPVGNVNYYALYRRVEGSGGGEASVTFKTKTGSDDGTDRTEDSAIKENLVESYTGISSFSASRAYLGLSGVKLGASGGSGYITLNLSSPITTNTITVHAAKYGTDTGDLQIEVNGSNSFGSALSPADGTLTFTNSSEVEISDLTISTTSKRAYVASISLGGGGTSYYTTSPVCTPCEHKVTLTKGAETNGTFTLSKANGEYDNCKSNFTVTVSNISPAEGYRFKNVTATGGINVAVSGPNGSGNYAVNYAKGNSVTSTVTAHFEQIPSHTVTWSANGNTSNQVSYKEGATITFPESATGCDGMTFMGWSAVEFEEQANAPTYTTSATMGDHDITFYAVFATANTTSSGDGAFDGSTGGTYKIYAQVGNTKYYAQGSSTLSSGKLSSTTNENEAAEFTFTKVSGGWTIQDGSKYMTYSSSTNLATSNSSYTWDIGNGTKGTWRLTSETSGRAWVFRASTTNKFGGYATNNVTAAGTEYYDLEIGGGSGGSSTTTYSGYTTSCSLCENKVTLVKGTPSNGSFTLDLAEGEYDNCHSAGLVVTVTSNTPDANYQFKEITQTGIASGVTIDNDAKTVTYAKDVTGTSTINVVFEPKPTYTVRFFDSGTKIYEETVVEGNTLNSKPSNPAGCTDYKFVGWWASELNTENTTSYTWLNSFGAVYSNQTYYAVYEHTEGGSIEQVYSKSPSGSGDLVANGAGTEYTLTIATGVTVTISGWSNNVPVYHSDGQWRIYGGSNVVIASTLGNISKIQFSSTQNNLSTSQGSYSSQVWTGDASSVTFTNSATQSRITGISVTVGGGGTTYYTTSPSCLPKVETPTFSVPGGEYSAAQSVTISCATSGASIYYTLDGSTPTTSSTLYTAAVTIPKGAETTLKAIAVKDGMSPSAVATATYDIRVYDIILSRSGITESIANVAHGTSLDAIDGDGDQGGCANWTFVGWSRTTVNPGEDYTPVTTVTAGGVYYAVYSGSSASNPVGWYKISSTDELVAGDHYIFVGVTDDKNYVMTNTYNGSANTMNTAQINETSAGYYAADVINDSYVYYLSGSSNSWQIRNVQTDKYVDTYYDTWYTDKNDELDTYTFSQNGSYWSVICKYGTNKYLSFNASSKVFSGNSSTSNNLLIYHYGTPGGTVNSTTTDCCDEVNAPEVTLIARSTTATISWNKQAGAANGYNVLVMQGSDVAFEQNYGKNVTTCEVTGLITSTAYTYTVTAKGATCNRATTGNFTTPDCDDVPYDITVTPYNVVQAIIRWKATSESAKIVVYSNESCTSVFTTITDAVSPCYVSDLEESTRYWFKIFGGESQDCESPVQTFLTQTTAVELVEWRDTAIVILLTGDENTASVILEDKEVETSSTPTKIAEDIFFSKYFEASGFTKLVGLYNGTNHAIDISDLIIKGGQNSWTESKGANNYIAVGDITKLKNDYGDGDKIMLPKNTEIILYSLRDENKSDYTGTDCVDGFYDWDKLVANTVENWYRIGKTNSSGSAVDTDGHNQLNFSGPYSIGLFRGTELIDIIGAGTASRPYDTYTVQKSNSTDSDLFPFTLGNGRIITQANDKEGFFCADGMAPPSEEYAEGYTTYLSTNLCFLMRKNDVVSGENAVTSNTEDFETLCSEWLGVPIGNDLSSTEKSCLSGGQFGYVGSYDYEGYYATFDSIAEFKDLDRDEQTGTITIPIPGLDTMSCSMLRVNVYDKNTGDLKASREYRVPIIIQNGEVKSTNQLFTKHGTAICKECDVLVYSGAKLTKDNTVEDRDSIGNLTLYPGSTLELPSGKGDYHVKSITYRVEGDSVPVTKLDGNLYAETKQLIVSRRIKNDRYYFISFPYDVNVNEITLANGEAAVNGKDFRLMEYDSEARATEGSLQGAPGHWKLFSGSKLLAGRGYAIAVNTKAMKEILFPMTIPSKNLTYEERNKQTNTVDINEYVGAARNTNHNWNLIAHPYITKFEVTEGAANVEAYWENPSRENTNWIDDWQTWTEDNPTQPTDTTHTQQPDTTTTHDVNIIMEGTLECGIVWVLYEDGSIELTGGGQMPDFTSLDAVPWAQHRQHIKNVKIGGEVQKIGQYAFSQCTNLLIVTIVGPVTNISSYAFAGCTQLRSFRIETTKYISATNATFNNISSLTMISLQVPQSMYDQYSQNAPWNKMAISAFDDNSPAGNAPRRAPVHDGWTESAGGVYITVPVVEHTASGDKVGYEQHWINAMNDIPPFTAVFIQGDGQGEMTFNMYPSGGSAPKRNKNADSYETKDHTVLVGLAINGNGKRDLTSLRLRPDFGEHYKFNLDLLKFTTFNTARPQIYIKTENDQLAFRAISDSIAANTWIPVGVYCRDAGTYTFSMYDRYAWDEVEAVYLRDNTTGTETNLLFGNYTITTTGQIYTNTRFSLKVLLRRKVVDTPTMIDHTEDPNAPRKFFRDGLLYILHDGKIYDATGKPVQQETMLNR